MSACTSEPVSWLRLERYALGELDGAAASAIRDHLAACAVCNACLAQIEVPITLSERLPEASASRRVPRRFWTWPRLAWTGGLLAAAAAFLLILRPGRDARPAVVPDGVRVKGDIDAVVTLVRDRAGAVTAEAATFEPGDRFSARITCTADAPVFADLVVFQDGEVSFPLPPAQLRCGNDVAFPGAFRLTGAGAQVCIALDATRTPDRPALTAGGARAPGLACRALDVEPAPVRAGICEALLPGKDVIEESLPRDLPAAGCLLPRDGGAAHVYVLCQDEAGYPGLMDAMRRRATRVRDLSVGRASFATDDMVVVWDDDAPCLVTINAFTGDADALASALAATLTPELGARIHALAP